MKLRISFLALVGLSSLASATGMTLMKARCTPVAGGATYDIHYWTSSAPGGPAAYHLDVSRGGADQLRLHVANPNTAVGEGMLLVGNLDSPHTGPKPQQALLYGRNDKGFLDVQGGGHSLNTPGPIEVHCRKSPH